MNGNFLDENQYGKAYIFIWLQISQGMIKSFRNLDQSVSPSISLS